MSFKESVVARVNQYSEMLVVWDDMKRPQFVMSEAHNSCHNGGIVDSAGDLVPVLAECPRGESWLPRKLIPEERNVNTDFKMLLLNRETYQPIVTEVVRSECHAL